MIVLVCGGRAYTDTEIFRRIMDIYHREYNFTKVIHGGAQGADFMAKMWAVNNGIPEQEFKANWGKYGRSAGPIRNQKMINEGKPKLVIAFPGGSGTVDMIKRAKTSRIEVLEIEI
jgi:hypothetical protein